jgi:glycosyltransferase involved in cell wall biosynthesis
MRVSVIIPHRNRHEGLARCVEVLGQVLLPDDEIIIADGGSIVPVECAMVLPLNAKVVTRPCGDIFNKCALQNAGIDAASGNVLAFIDADALVGPDWRKSFGPIERDTSLTKVCYRVRLESPQRAEWPGVFDRYDTLHCRYEGRGTAEKECYDEKRKPLFGNSHFAILRINLRGLRFNEDFVGAGYEDIWMNRELWRVHGDAYRAVMPADPRQNIVNLSHGREHKEWRTREILAENRKRYYAA